MLMLRTSFVCCMVVVISHAAHAATIVNDAPSVPTLLNGDAFYGSGIPGDDFTVGTADTGETLSLKARERSTGIATNVGNVYYWQPGLAPDNVNPWGQIDMSFSPGPNGLAATEYKVGIYVDDDPQSGVASFHGLTLPVSDPSGDSWDDGPSFYTNPGPGQWSNDSIPYALGESTHLAFPLWQLVGADLFNPYASGEYEIRMLVTDLNNTEILSLSIFAVVVPEPSSILLGLTGMAALGFIGWRRRSR